MYLLDVIPFARGIRKEQLTYYTTEHAKSGSLVSVPVRSRTIPALVVGVRDVKSAKTEVRRASFGLKKIKRLRNSAFFLSAFTRAATDMATYTAAPSGSVFDALIPRAITDDIVAGKRVAPASHAPSDEQSTEENRLTPEKLLLQAPEGERAAAYKSLIREAFAKRQSVYLCMPTVLAAETMLGALGRGIEEYTYVLHSDLTKKEQTERWHAALTDEHPVLIIGTGTFLALPRRDIQTIIVEHESASAYKMTSRPFIDIRTFSEYLAHARGAKLIWGDFPLRTETLYRREQGEFSDFTALKFRALAQADESVINMAEDTATTNGKREFRVISPHLAELVEAARTQSEQLFILAPRRGLYPVTVCSDCGEVVLCERCIAPVVLHRLSDKAGTKNKADDDKNIFVCHSCGTEYRSADRCGKCGGWRLAPLGIGIERIAETISEIAPDARIFRIDRDTTPTRKKAAEQARAFAAAPGSILIGTQMALPYLDPVPNVAVASLDATFTRPDFRAYERAYRLLLTLRGRATKNFLIQTRMRYLPIFDTILQGNIAEFYRSEIKQRKQFGYPPFTILIKLSAVGTPHALKELSQKMEELLANYNPHILPPMPSASAKGKHVLTALMRVQRSDWPDAEFAARLSELPPSVAINVDPEETG